RHVPLAAAWSALDTLHASGLAVRELDPDDLRVDDDGRVVFADLSVAELRPSEPLVDADAAQLLVLTASASGPEAAVAAALDHRGDRLAGLVPYLQPAVLTPDTRRFVREKRLDLAALRSAAADAAGIEEPELADVQRVSLGSLARVLMLVIVASTVIGGLSDIDWSSFGETIGDANWAWVVAALAVSFIARGAAGLVTLGVSPADLEPSPAVRLQSAM